MCLFPLAAYKREQRHDDEDRGILKPCSTDLIVEVEASECCITAFTPLHQYDLNLCNTADRERVENEPSLAMVKRGTHVDLSPMQVLSPKNQSHPGDLEEERRVIEGIGAEDMDTSDDPLVKDSLRTLHVQMDSCGAFKEKEKLMSYSPTLLKRQLAVGKELDLLKCSMVKELEAKLKSIQDSDKKKHRRSRSIGEYKPSVRTWKDSFGRRDRLNRMNREEKDRKCSQTERYYVHSHFLSASKGGMLSICFYNEY